MLSNAPSHSEPDDGNSPEPPPREGASHRRETILFSLAVGVLGALVLWGASGLRLGTIGRMGPGYFPILIGGLLVLTAVGLVLTERGEGDSEAWDLRALFVVPAAVVAFGLLLPAYGLIAACVAAVLIGRLALATNTIAGTLLLSVLLPLMIYAIFIVGLGLPLPVFPG